VTIAYAYFDGVTEVTHAVMPAGSEPSGDRSTSGSRAAFPAGARLDADPGSPFLRLAFKSSEFEHGVSDGLIAGAARRSGSQRRLHETSTGISTWMALGDGLARIKYMRPMPLNGRALTLG
jgi:hypothetical protein